MTCMWGPGTPPENWWTTSCGKVHQFYGAAPIDAEFVFCPFCAQRIIVDSGDQLLPMTPWQSCDVTVRWSNDANRFVATSDSTPGLSGSGPTREIAIAELVRAMAAGSEVDT